MTEESEKSKESRWGRILSPGDKVKVNEKGWEKHVGKHGIVERYIAYGTYFVRIEGVFPANSSDYMFDFAMLDKV